MQHNRANNPWQGSGINTEVSFIHVNPRSKKHSCFSPFDNSELVWKLSDKSTVIESNQQERPKLRSAASASIVSFKRSDACKRYPRQENKEKLRRISLSNRMVKTRSLSTRAYIIRTRYVLPFLFLSYLLQPVFTLTIYPYFDNPFSRYFTHSLNRAHSHSLLSSTSAQRHTEHIHPLVHTPHTHTFSLSLACSSSLSLFLATPINLRSDRLTITCTGKLTKGTILSVRIQWGR